MRHLVRRATNSALALFVVFAALCSSPLAAQSDPFALPEGMTAQSVRDAPGPGMSEIVVDGMRQDRMVDLQGHGTAMRIDAAAARAAGLPVPDGASGYIPLSSLPIYQFQFDSLAQRLSITLFRKAGGENLKDFVTATDRRGESNPLTALRIDYDLSATLSRSGASAGGVFDAAVVRGNMAFNTSVRVTSTPQDGSPAVLRLQTAATIAFENKGLVATAGDFVSAGSQTQRAVRLGGLQIGTDFSLRPDLVTTPLPAFSGNVAVPTSLDILTADSRYQLGEVKPGEFTVRNIPSQPGRGEVSVIMNDTLGREMIETTKFYMSRDLLAPKTHQYAANFGFVRRGFGRVSNDYGAFVATGFYRRGISQRLTVEASGEWSAGIANAGGRADLVLADVAQLTVEGRISHDGTIGSGALGNFALESLGRTISGRIAATIPTANYRDVAAHLGDEAPPRQYSAQLSYRLSSASEMQLSFARQEYSGEGVTQNPTQSPHSRFNEALNANFRARLSRRASFFAGGGYRRTEYGTGYSGAVGLSVSLGGQRHASALASYNDGTPSGALTYSKDAVRDGQVGYRAAVNASDSSQRVAGGLSWRNRNFLIDGQVEQVDGRFAARVDARGTLLVAGGTVFARNQSGGSYALVRTTGKVSGVPITRENRTVGATDRNGLLLVQNIPSQARIKIDVDADHLPADAVVRDTTHHIVVPRRAVALVEIDAVHFRPIMRKVVMADGRPVAPGMPVRMNPSGTTTMIGYDGMVEINAASGDSALVIGTPAMGCVVGLPAADSFDDSDDTPLVCQMRSIVESGQPAPGTKVARRNSAGGIAGVAPGRTALAGETLHRLTD